MKEIEKNKPKKTLSSWFTGISTVLVVDPKLSMDKLEWGISVIQEHACKTKDFNKEFSCFNVSLIK